MKHYFDASGKPTPNFTCLFKDLQKEVAWLHGHLNLYGQLYDSGQENRELLEWRTSGFFEVVQVLLIREISLSLCRLTDKPKSSNLSLLKIRNIIDPVYPATARSELDLLLADLQSKCKGARILRDNWVGHLSIDAVKKGIQPPPVDLKEVHTIICAVATIMRKLQCYFYNSDRLYEDFVPTGDGRSLLYLLREAREHMQCRLMPCEQVRESMNKPNPQAT
jgi:hypothetical protein